MISTEYAHAKQEIIDRDKKIKEKEEEILQLRNQLMIYENKINILTEENSEMQLKLCSKADTLEHQKLTIEVFEKQIYAINEALNNTQSSLETILSQKSRLATAKFKEFVEDDLVYKEIKLPEYFQHSYNFNFDPFYNQVGRTTPHLNENNSMTSRKNMGEALITYESVSEKEKRSLEGFDNESEREPGTPDNSNKNDEPKYSFISNLDLQHAFSNASNVRSSVIDSVSYRQINTRIQKSY